MRLPSLMVLDGETRSALSVVRSLGLRGVPIIVGSNSRFGRSNFSKYAIGSFDYPDIEENQESARDVILKKIIGFKPDILMPIYDPGWEVIYAHYDEFANLTQIIPNPGGQLFKNLLDKAILADLAEQNEIPIPQTYRPKTKEEALATYERLHYPVLLKPRTNAAGKGIKKVTSVEQFVKILEAGTHIPIIQEYIEGEDLELTLFSIQGDSLAGCTYLSLRNAPLPYGPPVACITYRDDTLMQIGIKFLKGLNYNGVAHLDFRRDRKDGQPKLLDFNARLAGTNEISTFSGIDFAYLQYLAASANPIERAFEFEIGLEYRWLLPGEIRHLLQTPYKLPTIKKLFKWRNVKTDVAFNDIRPHYAMLMDTFQRIYRRLRPKKSFILRR